MIEITVLGEENGNLYITDGKENRIISRETLKEAIQQGNVSINASELICSKRLKNKNGSIVAYEMVSETGETKVFTQKSFKIQYV